MQHPDQKINTQYNFNRHFWFSNLDIRLVPMGCLSKGISIGVLRTFGSAKGSRFSQRDAFGKRFNGMKIKKFEEIEAWQSSRELTRKVYQLTKKPEFSKDSLPPLNITAEQDVEGIENAGYTILIIPSVPFERLRWG